MAARLGLVSAAEAGPVQRVLDDVCRPVADIEQACDLGEGERDHAPTPWGRGRAIHYC